MARKLTGKTVSAFALFTTIFLVLAFSPQMSSAGQALGWSPVVSATAQASTPIQALQHLLLRAAGGAQRIPVRRSQRRGSVGHSMDPDPLVFLFFPSAFYDFGGITASVAVKDVNGDGKPDLVAFGNLNVYGGGGLVGVFLGNGDGTFRPVVNYSSGGFVVNSGAVVDVNGDGKPDLVVANCSSANGLCDGNGSVGVLLGNGDGTFRPVVTYDSGGGGYVQSIAVADVNGDGKPDVLVANRVCFNPYCLSPGAVSVLLGNGDGTFRAAVSYSSGGSSSNSVAVTDVNGDSKPDLLVANCNNVNSYCDGNGSVGVLLGNGDGTFQPAVNCDSGGAYAVSVAAGDVNSDGKPDLLVANGWSDTVGVLLGNGDGTFQAAVTYNTIGQFSPDGAHSVTISDVNGDGKPDLVLGSVGVGLLLGNGDGTFGPVVTYNPGQGGESVAVADVNGDGKPDLAVTTIYGVSVLLNNSGAPSTATSLVSSVNPVTIKQMVTYTATVTLPSGGTVKGTVVFMDGDYLAGLASLAGNQAALSLSYTYLSSHPITAVYVGDLNNASACISNTLTENMRGTSKTVVTTSGSPSLVGQPVTFTAKVTSKYGAIQDGELVTFADGKMPLASVALSGGHAVYTTSALSGGTHAIKATYAGDATLAPSTGGTQQIVNKYPTTTALSSSSNPSVYGHAVTFTATVTPTGPYPPTGKVKFWDGTLAIGSATLSGGVATLTKSKLAAGTHPITAQYPGDAASDKSTSSVLNQVVQ